jgi:L-asparaginase II
VTLPDDLLHHTPHPADVAPGAAAGELAVVVRSGVVESRHVGHAVLVAPDGEVAAAVGEATTTFYPRSSAKPWQAATIRRVGAQVAGTPLDGPQLAIAAGSHSGREAHVDLVTTMLHDAGLDVTDLQCPSALPGDEAAHHAWIVEDRDAAPEAYNCSGKHAAMLLACVANGWPTATYLEPDHPLQAAIRGDLEDAIGTDVAHVAVDGCGAPLYALPLDALGRAAAAWRDGDEHQRAVADAMRAHPWAVAGPGREDTVAMTHLPGLVAKKGADGVQLLFTEDGWAVVVKVLDGAHRAAMTAALTLLGRAPGIDVADAAGACVEPVLGHGRPVGAVLPGADVRA